MSTTILYDKFGSTEAAATGATLGSGFGLLTAGFVLVVAALVLLVVSLRKGEYNVAIPRA